MLVYRTNYPFTSTSHRDPTYDFYVPRHTKKQASLCSSHKMTDRYRTAEKWDLQHAEIGHCERRLDVMNRQTAFCTSEKNKDAWKRSVVLVGV